jgi:hypothetical protein
MILFGCGSSKVSLIGSLCEIVGTGNSRYRLLELFHLRTEAEA